MGGTRINWSWQQMQETPLYVRRFVWDLKQIKQRELNRRAERSHGR